jgi:hypothetical protein
MARQGHCVEQAEAITNVCRRNKIRRIRITDNAVNEPVSCARAG